MSYHRAMQILDAVRGGANYPAHIVDEALRLTGDLEEE